MMPDIDVGAREAKLRMVEQIEHFHPEIKSHILPRQRKPLDDREVGIHEVWPGKWGSG